ncbi:MAG: choice-of-anchor D domain-containing protein [Myxococcales bacterium]|nr:choice-of-anchor D domain-containing protein [Myxococcales bacterium]
MNAISSCLVAVAFASACTTEEPGTGSVAGCPSGKTRIETAAKLEVRDPAGAAASASVVIDGAPMATGSVREFVLVLSNTAPPISARPLTVKSVALVETDADGKVVSTGPQFTCKGPGGKPCAEATWPVLVPAGLDAACKPKDSVASTALTVTYTRGTAATPRKARLDVTVEGDPLWKDAPRTLEFKVQIGSPKLVCVPASVDFGKVAKNQGAEAPFKCTNAGTGQLVFDSLEIVAPSMPVEVQVAGGPTVTPTKPFAGTPKLALAANETLEMTVRLLPIAEQEKLVATLRITTNDAGIGTLQVPLKANATGPCLKASALSVEFGAVPVGSQAKLQASLESCGTEDVALTGLGLEPGSTAGFQVEPFGCVTDGGAAPTVQKPLVLPPTAKCTFYVTFSPSQVGTKATGKIVVPWNAGVTTDIALSGEGVQAACPVACLTLKNDANGQKVLAGKDVVPQTPLTLDAACSSAPQGHVIDTWKWSVAQPQGSFSTFAPSAQAKVVKFQPNISGKYTFSLDVTDDSKVSACKPAVFELNVIADDLIHVELTWDTPTDPNKTDTGKDKTGAWAGSDVDLHLAHPNAIKAAGQPDFDKNGEPDPWFAPCDDAYWFNKLPKWGDLSDPEDDPRLDLDDYDGWGPENLNIKAPEPGLAYFVGVYYASDNQYGLSTPRVRVYLDHKSVADLDKTGPAMKTGDLWCVARISWNPNKITPCKGADAKGNLVTPAYPQVPKLCK